MYHPVHNELPIHFVDYKWQYINASHVVTKCCCRCCYLLLLMLLLLLLLLLSLLLQAMVKTDTFVESYTRMI